MPKTLGDARHEALIAFLVAKRNEVGITQTELASRLKVYQSLVARMESGERRVDVVEFIKLAHVLGFDPAAAITALVEIEG